MAEYNQIRTLTRPSHRNLYLDSKIRFRIAVFLDKTSRPALPDVFFRLILTQFAGDVATDLPWRYEVYNIATRIFHHSACQALVKDSIALSLREEPS